MKKDIWIAGIARGHNASVCLLKNGEIIFSLEEERLSRRKWDGGPFAGMIKILEYTDKIDYLVVAHTHPLEEMEGKVDFTGDNIYTGMARKLGLIDRKANLWPHPQVIDMSRNHHKLHTACAFYRSGFDSATGIVVDGAGTNIDVQISEKETIIGWETETVYTCNYPADFTTVYKHIGGIGPNVDRELDFPAGFYDEYNEDGTQKIHKAIVTEKAGIVKVYEAVTDYLGFNSIEAGKTMGLSPYGKPNNNIPKLFTTDAIYPTSNRNLIIPTYPNGAKVNYHMYDELIDSNNEDLTKMQNRRDLAYAVQEETQNQVLDLIIKAVETTGNKNVVLSGGYGLNCVANYYYLTTLNELGINLYVEPISNDAGTAIGAALMIYKDIVKDTTITITNTDHNLYLGPVHKYTTDDINSIAAKYNAEVRDATHADVIELMTSKNIVANFQGRSENGPRALGNRSLMFDPTFKDGKDFVNEIKRREYFRPFAGSILEEDVHEWFDLRGMASSPTMMYAVNCQPGIEEKIPAIIHVDGTCRIQTVNREQNPHYYDIIKAFKEKTGCPIIFNTSFNLGGEPLVETLDDALWTLQESDIEYLYLPEYNKLVTVKN
jgi:carbamoyltransferase